jgi:hypothetical protein
MVVIEHCLKYGVIVELRQIHRFSGSANATCIAFGSFFPGKLLAPIVGWIPVISM